MDSEELYNNLYDKPAEQFKEILERFLDETSAKDIQAYNSFSDLDNFTHIWMIIKKYDLGDLAVKFINKLILIKQEDPQRNKFMIGFANNSEHTMNNLRFLKKYDPSLSTLIYDTYTTQIKKDLFAAHSSKNKDTIKLGGKRNNSKKLKKKTKKRTTRSRPINIGKYK